MTCSVIRWQPGEEGGLAGTVKRMSFSCDHPEGCEAQPDDQEIIAAGGMVKMGWLCTGGKHFCPEHAEEARERVGTRS